jgi:hypothetical protein
MTNSPPQLSWRLPFSAFGKIAAAGVAIIGKAIRAEIQVVQHPFAGAPIAVVALHHVITQTVSLLK